MLLISRKLQIPIEEFEFTFARSGGPGGQNVNKVNSKAILRWSVAKSPSVPEDVRQRFYDKFSNRITVDGDLILTSQKYRDQGRNVDSCLEKLRVMLVAVVAPPTPRRPTKPNIQSRKRRVEKKREQSQKKQMRRQPMIED